MTDPTQDREPARAAPPSYEQRVERRVREVLDTPFSDLVEQAAPPDESGYPKEPGGIPYPVDMAKLAEHNREAAPPSAAPTLDDALNQVLSVLTNHDDSHWRDAWNVVRAAALRAAAPLDELREAYRHGNWTRIGELLGERCVDVPSDDVDMNEVSRLVRDNRPRAAAPSSEPRRPIGFRAWCPECRRVRWFDGADSLPARDAECCGRPMPFDALHFDVSTPRAAAPSSVGPGATSRAALFDALGRAVGERLTVEQVRVAVDAVCRALQVEEESRDANGAGWSAYELTYFNGKWVAATVWPNGVWHTWDRNGVGGWNNSAPTVKAAKRAAEDALAKLGWLVASEDDKCENCGRPRSRTLLLCDECFVVQDNPMALAKISLAVQGAAEPTCNCAMSDPSRKAWWKFGHHDKCPLYKGAAAEPVQDDALAAELLILRRLGSAPDVSTDGYWRAQWERLRDEAILPREVLALMRDRGADVDAVLAEVAAARLRTVPSERDATIEQHVCDDWLYVVHRGEARGEDRLTCALCSLRTVPAAPSEAHAPGQVLHDVVTALPGLWHELDDEDRAMWAADEARVLAGTVPASERCEVTGNPCGTDTWTVGQSCSCAPCRRYVAASERAEPQVSLVFERHHDGLRCNYRVQVILPGVEHHALTTARYNRGAAELIADDIRAALARTSPPA